MLLLQEYSKLGRLTSKDLPTEAPSDWHSMGTSSANFLLMYTARLIYLVFCLGVLGARRTDPRYLPVDAPIRLAFHGTPQENIPSILEQGLLPSRRRAHLSADFFTESIKFAKDYTRDWSFARPSQPQILVFLLLVVEPGLTYWDTYRKVLVMRNEAYQLPVAV
jgi:hypothetical protein